MDGTRWPPAAIQPAPPAAAALPKSVLDNTSAFPPQQFQGSGTALSPERVQMMSWKNFFIQCGTKLEQEIHLDTAMKPQLSHVLRTIYTMPVQRDEFPPYFLGILRCLNFFPAEQFSRFYPIVEHYMATAITLKFSSSRIYFFVQALPENFYPEREQKVQFYVNLCQQKGSFIHFFIQMHIDESALDDEEDPPCCHKNPQEFPFLAQVALKLLLSGVHPEFIEEDNAFLAYFFGHSYPVCVSKGCEPVNLALVLNTLAQVYQSHPNAVEIQDLLRLLLDVPLPPTQEAMAFFQSLLARADDALEPELLEGRHIGHYLPLFHAALPSKITPENILYWLPFLSEGARLYGVEFIRPHAHRHPLLGSIFAHQQGIRTLQLAPLFNQFEQLPQITSQLIFKAITRFMEEGSTFSDVNEDQFTDLIQRASCHLDRDFFILIPLIVQRPSLLRPLAAALDTHPPYSQSPSEQFTFIGKLAQRGFFTTETLQRPYLGFCHAREEITWNIIVLEAGLGFIQILGWNCGHALGFFAAVEEMKNVVPHSSEVSRFAVILERLAALQPQETRKEL